jgi:hypothetical protein
MHWFTAGLADISLWGYGLSPDQPLLYHEQRALLAVGAQQASRVQVGDPLLNRVLVRVVAIGLGYVVFMDVEAWTRLAGTIQCGKHTAVRTAPPGKGGSEKPAMLGSGLRPVGLDLLALCKHSTLGREESTECAWL